MDILGILIAIVGIYVFLLVIWWIICLVASKNAINSRHRAHFDFVEMLDVAVMRFWRFIGFCVLAGIIVWLILIGKWYFAIIPALWTIKVWWFGSFFYFPFNLIESHYMAKVQFVFGMKHTIEHSKDRAKQVQSIKDRGWTVPDKMK